MVSPMDFHDNEEGRVRQVKNILSKVTAWPGLNTDVTQALDISVFVRVIYVPILIKFPESTHANKNRPPAFDI